MLGSGLIGILMQGNRQIRVPKRWLVRFAWSAGERIRLTAGQKSLGATVRGHDLDHVSVSQDIVRDLRLPDGPITWKANRSGIRFGPFVAVYSRYTGSREKPFGTITRLLQDMTSIARELHIPLYITPIGGLDRERRTVAGWSYDERSATWREGEYPWPDVCMKKTILLPPELKSVAKQEFHQLQVSGVKMFYRPLESKLAVHRMLAKDPAIAPYLPQTRKLRSARDVFDMLQSFPVLYLKPAQGTQGRDVYRVSRHPEAGKVRMQIQQAGGTRRVIVNLAAQQAWFYKTFVVQREFLVQQGIELIGDGMGRAADFRWLIQRDGNGRWQVTARVARLGQKGSVTSNVSTGADVFESSDLLRRAGFAPARVRALIGEMDRLALQIAKRIERRKGEMGELGIDFAVDRGGRPWLIEVNPNPGRRMLKILDPAIRALSLRRALEYARYTAGFRDGSASD
ncbi:YheC/YheD family endospore coat-associated protein [Effusibacillus pohliae]|uniref:YheC/YheD family endospore coat-associated protein n=1 Tax=Effusibacillus pohliae TaxID=232270 RepID=UPI00036FAAE8|nr:YheC/YheD family protein [Effusibacillus pohliae]